MLQSVFEDEEKIESNRPVGVGEGLFDLAESLEVLRRTVSERSYLAELSDSSLTQLDQLDPNFPQSILDRASALLKLNSESASEAEIRQLLGEINVQKDLILNDSPYPEVRAVVSNTDDPSMECNTFRVW